MLEAMMAVFNFNSFITALNVFILFFAVGYFGGGMVKKVFSKRQNAITEERETTRQNMEEAASLKAEYEEKLKSVEKEAGQIVEQAHATAKHREELKMQDADIEAKRIVGRAEVEAELEKKRVNDEIKQEIIDSASVIAGKLIADNMNGEYSDELIKESLNGMGESVWQN